MAPHTRTRTGCWTCRESGYKCDEKKPFCGRCTRLNITCKGYGIKLKWKNTTAQPASGKRPRSGRARSVEHPQASSPLSTSSITSAPATLDMVDWSPSPEWPRATDIAPMIITPTMSPDLSTGDKRLLQYWVEQLSTLISVTPGNRAKSPYQIHLTAMAYSPGALRSTVLSMAAHHLALVSGDGFLKLDAYRHQRDAIQQLQRLIQIPEDSSAEPALATVLMMQVSMRLFGEGDAAPSVVNHLVGAKAMLSQKRGDIAIWSKSPSVRFLLSLFAYHDILSSVSRSSSPFINHGGDFDAVEGISSMKGIARVLHIVAGISELQDIARHGGTISKDPTSFARFSVIGSGLEQTLSSLDLSAAPDHNENDSKDISATAEAYRHAAFIYLYRIWHGIGAPNPITLHHVQQCLSYLAQVDVSSALISSHIWPIFTAGCEAIDVAQRQFVRDRLAAMFESRKFPVMRKLMADIEDVWACKDLESVIGGQDGMEKVDCISVIRRRRGREVDLA
ncbi:hypothetical protein BU24DRAFT_85992 [Aaosphaeria arxii CBS 175.79]|uniref:Zn(2)-C6 fungal-type domain-containing protein n=1 Tax=Aaosphaeria arxii CBS 175.79 TaxID=1450172 RepID=A0A6A5X8I8_9PLEO|nr:uncharacterized protein BU24DRAFT_85992 [Aaosphaeria arxii CBS 175.79]KAF2009262.1 hypothetical protein BU24DRAFT_85992 [Aaosphaeria arxii CBS 175.79]